MKWKFHWKMQPFRMRLELANFILNQNFKFPFSIWIVSSLGKGSYHFGGQQKLPNLIQNKIWNAQICNLFMELKFSFQVGILILFNSYTQVKLPPWIHEIETENFTDVFDHVAKSYIKMQNLALAWRNCTFVCT